MKSRTEIARAIDVLDKAASDGVLPTSFNPQQQRMCGILNAALRESEFYPRNQIEWLRDKHGEFLGNPSVKPQQQNLHRLYHAANCWLLDDLAGGDFVPQLIADLESLAEVCQAEEACV